MSCEEQPRYGQPSTCQNDENLENVRNAINADRRRTIDEISEITDLSLSSCQRMLTEDLNMKRVSAKFVPRLLKEESLPPPPPKKQSFECLLRFKGTSWK